MRNRTEVAAAHAAPVRIRAVIEGSHMRHRSVAAHSPTQAYADTGGSHMAPAAIYPIPVARTFSFSAGLAAFGPLVFRRMRRSHGFMMPNPAFERTRISMVGMRVTALVCVRLRARRSTQR